MNLTFLPHAIFFLCLGAFGVLSAVLIYHWRRYGEGAAFIAAFEIVHLLVGIMLLSAALFLLLQL